MQTLARIGCGSRGVVYLIIGALAAMSALGLGGGTEGSKGALRTLMAQPFGTVLVAAMAAGLLAFFLWRVAQAALDADRHGREAKGVVVRTALMISGLIYLGLAFTALSLVVGWGSGDDEQGAKEWTALLLAQPFGGWAVAAAGAAVVAAGLAIGFRGAKGSFTRRLALDEAARRWVEPLGRYGLVARGVVLVVIGGFLARAAWQADSDNARGLAGALDAVRAQPYGAWLFAAVAAGLLAFGVFGLAQARYRSVTGP